MTKRELLSYFFKYPIKMLPVVDKRGKILGVIRKQDVISATPTVDSLEEKISQFLEQILVCILPESNYRLLGELMSCFSSLKKIPVITKDGNLWDFFDKFQILCSWEGFPYPRGLLEVFNYLSLPVYVLDNENKIIFLSQKAKELLGKSKSKSLNLLIEEKGAVEYFVKLQQKEYKVAFLK